MSVWGYEGAVTFTVKANVNYTARDWQLFTASMDCSEAAAGLNAAASEALSCGSPERAYSIFTEAQQKYSKYGAYDSEPSREFDRLVRKVYRIGEDD